MEIKSISRNLLGAKQNNKIENNSNHSNPFGVNYKGNMINADVFSVSFSGAKEKAAEGIAARAKNRVNKFVDAIRVGSMNAFQSLRLNSIASFGKRIKASATNLWNDINNTFVNIHISSAKNILKPQVSLVNYSVNSIRKQSISNVRGMLENIISDRAAERV